MPMVNEPLDGDRLQAFFDTLPDSLLRAKGVLNLAEKTERRTIYQRVGKRWSYTTAEPWGNETPHSSLVFIGPASSINSRLKRSLTPAGPTGLMIRTFRVLYRVLDSDKGTLSDLRNNGVKCKRGILCHSGQC